MIRRSERTAEVDARIALREALRAGVAALRDPESESRVLRYFEDSSTFNLDVVQVAV